MMPGTLTPLTPVDPIDDLLTRMFDEDLDTAGEDALMIELHALDDRQEERLRVALRNVPLEVENGLYYVYDLLARDSGRWCDVLVEELDRLLAAAERSRYPETVLKPLTAYFSLIDDSDSSVVKKLRACLIPYLDSKVEVVRRRAASMIGDFTFRENRKVIERLLDLMEQDRSWRVRYAAFVALTQAEAVPPGTRLSLADRLRAWIFDPAP